MPRLVACLFAIEFAFIGIYILSSWTWIPYRDLFDLDHEKGLPTWFATIQLFVISVLYGIFAWSRPSLSLSRRLIVWSLPLLFLALSIDEFVSLHELLGRKSDSLLLGVEREASTLHRTGSWMIVLGAPFLVAVVSVFFAIRQDFDHCQRAWSRLVFGVVILLLGALGVEFLTNFVEPGTWPSVFEVCAEEGLELIGATCVLWSALEALGASGLRLAADPARSAQL